MQELAEHEYAEDELAEHEHAEDERGEHELDAEREVVGGGAAGGVGGGGQRYSLLRCASQCSLDESSQPPRAPPPAAAHHAPAHHAHHAAQLLRALRALQEDAALCDVRLLAEGEAEAGGEGGGVAAHRAVLAAASPYFRAMFTAWEERTRAAVTIRGVEAAALRDIVRYVYAPEALHVAEHSVQALLAAASLLQVGGVRRACCAFLAAALAPDNALGIRAFAELHACAELAALAQRYVHAHAHRVLQGDEFLALEPPALAQLLASDRLTVPGEEVVLDAVLRWVRHGGEERREALGALLEHVRLPLVAQEALVARAGAEPLAGAGVRVKDLLIEALSFHLLRPERRAAAAAGCARARPRRPARAPRLLLAVGGQAPKAVRAVEALRLDGAGAGPGAALGPAGWTPRADLPARRCRAGLAVLDGRVLAIGGFNGTLRVRTVDVYDVRTDTWSAGPALGARRSTLGVAVVGGRVYAVGGFDGAAGLSSAEVLEPGAGGAGGGGGWRPVAPMSTRRSSVGVAALGGRLYAVGGYDGAARQCLHTVERYDPALDAWEPVAEMSARRSGAGVGVLGETLYAVGGHDGPAVRRSVERYREGPGGGGGWLPAPHMASARRNAAVAAHADRLYVVGGDDGAANLDTVEVFDPATDTWCVLADTMAVGRSYAGVAVVDCPHPHPHHAQPQAEQHRDPDEGDP